MNDSHPSSQARVETLYRGHWLTMKQRGHWEYVERNNPGGAAIIIAMTDAGNVLFVEQFRVPIQQHTIEMPAGLVGDLDQHANEDALRAAARELEEETGYACEHMEHVHSGPSSAGMSTEIMHFVRACGLRKVGPGGGDDSENIVVHEVPQAKAGGWLLQKAAAGYSIDPKLFAGLWLLDNQQSSTS